MEIILNIAMKYTLISENTLIQPTELLLSFLDSSQEVSRLNQKASNSDGFLIPLKICRDRKSVV